MTTLLKLNSTKILLLDFVLTTSCAPLFPDSEIDIDKPTFLVSKSQARVRKSAYDYGDELLELAMINGSYCYNDRQFLLPQQHLQGI